MGKVTPFQLMKLNQTPIECFPFISVCLAVYIWTIHNDPIALWDMRQLPQETKRPRVFRGLSILDTSFIGKRERRD